MFFRRVFTFFFLIPIAVHAMPINRLPSQLMFQGKQVDPLCLFSIESTTGLVDLATCGIISMSGATVSGENDALISQGFIGYNYRISPHTEGYSYYKSLGTAGTSVIVQTINNSGGTGTFSFLNLIQRNGDKINVSVLKGGDRCNGSVVDAVRLGDHLTYGVQLTPYDVLTLAHDNPHQLKAYDDLSACATCCVGKAVYQRVIGHDVADEKLVYLDVSTYLQPADRSSSTQKYQACFDKLMKEDAIKNKGKLDFKKILRFTHQFNAQCIS